MESEDQLLKKLFERTNRKFEFISGEIKIPEKQWFNERPFGLLISIAASITLFISGSMIFPISESIFEWSSHSFELYQKGIVSCLSALSNI